MSSTGGKRDQHRQNGHPLMATITARPAMSSAATGCFLAVNR